MRGINHGDDWGWAGAPRKGSSGGTSTTVQNNSPPPEVMANYRAITDQANRVASQDYPTYNGQLIAGFNPEQQTAFQNIDKAAYAGTPFINAASDAATNAMNLLSPQNFGGTIAAYQDPYTQQVVDATQAQFDNSNAIQQQQVKGNAISAGAWGGDRSAVAQGITAGQEQLAQAPVIAGLRDKGFSTALNAAQGNAWLNSQGAFSLGQLGQEAQQQGLAGAGAQLQAGTLQQQMQQQQLNLPYESFLAAQGFPYQATGWLSNIDLGLGSASGGTGSTTSPGPSALSQVAGLGIAGAGLYGAANNAGWFGGSGGSGPNLAAIQSAAASTYGAGTSSANFVDPSTGMGAIYRSGGRIGREGFAFGGVPNLDVSVFPAGPNPGGHSLLAPAGSTSSSSGGGPSDAQQAESAIGTIAQVAAIAALLRKGGRVGRDDGGAVGFGGADIPTPHPAHPRVPTPHASADFLRTLGGLGELASIARAARSMSDSSGGRVMGLDPMQLPERFDLGGTPTPSAGAQAASGGNPMLAQQMGSYASMPTEKLQELSARLPPTTPQGAVVARALQQRRMAPQADPAQRGAAPSGGMTLPGYAAGGTPEINLGASDYDWRDDAPGLGADAGAMPELSDYVAAPARGRQVASPSFGGASAQALPEPPVPPESAPPRDTGEPVGGRATFGGADAAPSHGIPWQTLLAAGLGIMGGRSPFPGVNIGQGGLEGLKFGEQQRLREEQAALRQLQAQELADYRRGTLAVRDRHETSYADRVSAISALDQARAAKLTAAAAMKGASHATEGDILAQAVKSLVGTTNPDTGEPWTQADAFRYAKGIDVRKAAVDARSDALARTGDQADRRLDQSDQRIGQSQSRIQQSADYQAQTLALRRQGMDDATVNNIMTNASRITAMTPGVKLEDAVTAQTKGRTTLPQAATVARPTAPTAPQAGMVQDGYRFKGGDPSQQSSWELVH